MELKFIKERKADEIVRNACDNLMDFAKNLTPVEKSAALAWINAALLAGMAQYGREFAYKPTKLDKDVAVQAIIDFSAFRKTVEDASESVSGRKSFDPAVSAFKWELFGAQVIIILSAVSFSDAAKKKAIEVFEMLSANRVNAKEAVKAMWLYAKTYGVKPVPEKDGAPSTDKQRLMLLATSLPPLFDKKKSKKTK